MIEIQSPLARLAVSARALGLLALAGAAVGFTIGLVGIRGPLDPFFMANQIGPGARRFMLAFMFGGAGAAAATGAWFLWRAHKRALAAARIHAVARRLAPLCLAPFPLLLFRHKVWAGKPLPFLTMVALFVASAWAATKSAAGAPLLRFEAWIRSRIGRVVAKVDPAGRGRVYLPVGLVTAAAAFYVAMTLIQTLGLHLAARSGIDLAGADHFLWSLLHGRSPWQSSLGHAAVSPDGPHVELVAYALAPFYALAQRAGTLLVLQALLIGGAALPLFVLGRRHIGSGAAAVVVLAYLLHPAVHAQQLSGFHFLSLGPIFLWSAWALLSAGRVWSAVPFVALTLAVREDAAIWIAVLGLYFWLVGRRPITGLVLAAVGLVFFAAMNSLVLPKLGAPGGFARLFGGLVPPGEHGPARALVTVAENPALVATTLAEMPRLVYLLQIFLPVALLPLRAAGWLLLVIPGFWLTLLPADALTMRSLASPAASHWIAFLFPGVILGIEALGKRDPSSAGRLRAAALVALVCAAVPMAYELSPLFSDGADAPGTGLRSLPGGLSSADGARRYQAVRDLSAALPARAKVACSRSTASTVSNRPDVYLLSSGVGNAEYLFFPTAAEELVDNERGELLAHLRGGTFGIVAVHEPFALARRGHSTAGNAAVLARL